MRSMLDLFALIAFPMVVLGDEDTGRLRAVADEHVGRWVRADQGPPIWQNARTAEVVPVEAGPATLYKCKLKADQKDAGYVILAPGPQGPQPVMWSASPCPDEYVKSLSVPSGMKPLSPDVPIQCEIRALMPLIGIPDTEAKDFRPSSLACCAVSMLYWAETQIRRPIFLSVERIIPPMSLAGPPFSESPQPSTEEDKLVDAYFGTVEALYSEPNVTEIVVSPSGKKLRRVKDPAGVVRRLGPPLRSLLKKNLSERGRLRLLQEEYDLSGSLVNASTTPGARLAVIHQMYLAENVEGGLNDLLHSRGLAARWESQVLTNLTHDTVPCILLGPQKQALVILGIGTMADTDLLVCYVPGTIASSRVSRAEYAKELRRRTLRLLPKASPSTRPHEQSGAGRSRPSAADDPANEDRRIPLDAECESYKSPSVHFVRKEVIAGWQAHYLTGLH
jgi:hypothetical protein